MQRTSHGCAGPLLNPSSFRPFEVISLFGSQPAPHERVYVFHGTASTQLLGADRLVSGAQQLLAAAGVDPHVTPTVHTDISPRPYTNESLQDPILDAPSGWHRSHSTVAELSVQLPAREFWDRISAGSWATWTQQWPAPHGSPLFPPSSPDWLLASPRWELDPLAPALGPAAPGGWIFAAGQPGNQGQPSAGSHTPARPSTQDEQPDWVGLFQLTDVESFWVLSSPERLDRVVTLCEQLSATHSAFTWLTGYFDPGDVLGSLRLPMECAPVLEFALAERGYAVDVWW